MYAAQHGSTLYMVLLAAYTILLHKYSGQEDIIVGTPIASRTHPDIEPLIGMFVNTLAIRTYPHGSMPFLSYLQEMKETALGAYEHQDYLFEQLVENVQVNRDLSRNPVFDAMFVLQNTENTGIRIEGLELKPYQSEYAIAKFDLVLDVREESDGLSCSLQYATALFNRETAQRMAKHFAHLVDSIIEAPEAEIADLSMLSSKELAQILHGFNDTTAEYQREKTIQQLFEEQVQQNPNAVAVRFEQEQLTYRALNERANRLARTLRAAGVKPDQLVGIMAERSLEMVVGLMAILKAGGAYVPIDPDYPQERISYMLEDSGTQVLLVQEHRQQQAVFEGTVILLDHEQSYHEDGANLESVNVPSNAAYVIYTSGTTGKPKGTLIEHKNVVRLLFNSKNLFDFGPSDTWTLFHSFCFDFSVWEMYGALLYGGKLVIVPSLAAKNPAQFLRLLAEQQVTILNQTPTYFYQLLREALAEEAPTLSVRKVIFGGEALSPQLLKNWRAKYPATQLINMYGITETTVHVTYKEITEVEIEQAKSNIGRPIPTLNVYVLDAKRNCVPVGVTGEMYVAGEGLARLYLNRPDLTNEKFVDNPFDAGAKMYRSGDLARWLPDGSIEYLGRIDHQVKIRGYRIELGEIETQLTKVEAVQEAIVLACEDGGGEKHLCAYFVADQPFAVNEIRSLLSQELPGYMIPSYFVQMDRMPLTSNGKIDRKALPAPEGRLQTGEEHVAPRTSQEAQLAEIWREVLRLERVGVKDNFFELGGHSLRAATLVSMVRKAMNVDLPLRDVFHFATIEQMAYAIGKLEQASYSFIPSIIEENEFYPLSSAQKRLYVLQQLEGAELSYNMPVALRLAGSLDRQRLERALQALVARHESLRTEFAVVDGEPMQRIVASAVFSVTYEEATEEEAQERVRTFLRPFDLSEAPLLRTTVVRVGEANHLLLFDMHHIISDGTSMSIFVQEFTKLYGYEEATEEEAQERVRTFLRPFDLSEAPLLRTTVVRVGEANHLLLFDMHHIISDGTSMSIFVQEFTKLYGGEELEPLRLQYKDYAVWQQSCRESASYREMERYWLKQFAGELPVLSLPLDYPLPAVRSFEGARVEFELDSELSGALRELARTSGATVYMVLLAAYSALLGRLSSQEELIVGTPIAGRSHADLQGMLGMFVNTLALRLSPSGEKPFSAYLQEVKQTALSAFEHGDYPFEELVEQVVRQRDLSRNPLFDAMLVLQNTEQSELELADLQWTPYPVESGAAKFDLTLSVSEEEQGMRCTLEYAVKLFERATIERWVGHFTELLRQVTRDSHTTLGSMDLLTAGQREQLLVDFNDTGAEVLLEQRATLHALFEEQAAKTPERVAVVCGEEALTYQELNERSSSVAFNLQKRGVAPADVVAIMPTRSVELIVGILGILKTGAAYVPIDPDYPTERIHFMLEDSRARFCLTHQAHVHQVKQSAVEVLLLDGLEKLEEHSEQPLPAILPTDVAYIIYTSGSTGRPKGVMIEHRSVVHLCRWHQAYFDMSATDRTTQYAGIGFDAAAWEIFPSLTIGAAVHIVPEDLRLDPAALNAYFEEKNITVSFLPTQVCEQFITLENRSLRVLLTGGDRLKKISHTRYALYNNYGPTEGTVLATSARVDASLAVIPIGKPISNTRVYVLTQENGLQPVGAVGELCISGVGLARGYWDRADLTLEKFVSNPFEPGERMYRTGDLVRWQADGSLAYVGRRDEQVKIRGYRIELSEIEAVLLRGATVREAIVQALPDAGGSLQLCAYVVGSELEIPRLRSLLSASLPAYMVPASLSAVRLRRRQRAGDSEAAQLAVGFLARLYGAGLLRADGEPATHGQRQSGPSGAADARGSGFTPPVCSASHSDGACAGDGVAAGARRARGQHP
nr:non-ribosomal peptide synthetase [Paenibacillus sp. Leaf72]